MKPYKIIKQILDFILAVIGMLLLWPFFLIIAFVIKLDSKGPIFFKQKRVGKNRKEFLIFKFRTMNLDAPKEMPTHLLIDSGNFITKVGKFLRRTSLDEIPQIINILKGEMSIIGPRPALWNQYDLIEEREKYNANSVLPGLTGWAQINGRDELSIDAKAKLDGEYVEKLGFFIDVKCFFKTIVSVLKSDGILEGETIRNNNKF